MRRVCRRARYRGSSTDGGQSTRRWRHDRLDKDRWVYVWAGGIYSGLRAEQQRLCALVVVGVNERGEKHFLAIEDGIRGIHAELARSAARIEGAGR